MNDALARGAAYGGVNLMFALTTLMQIWSSAAPSLCRPWRRWCCLGGVTRRISGMWSCTTRSHQITTITTTCIASQAFS